MSLVFRDRIHQRVSPTPPAQAIPGQWVLETTGRVSLNREPTWSGDYLLPDARHEWTVTDEAEGLRLSGQFDRNLLLAEKDGTRILDICVEVESALAQPESWEALTQLSPVMRNLDKRARLQPLEKDITRGLGYLHRVCTRPRLHLKSEQERVPTSRARRLDNHATAYLAAHTEDWEARTVLGVQPKRLLATIIEDQWDIYENRVAVRLVDQLLRDVVDRIAEVGEVLSLYQRAQQEILASSEGTHWRSKRLYQLWGMQLEDTEQGRRTAQETLHTLEKMRRALLGLKDSPLYRAIPPRAQVATEQRRTNILLNDPSYREVAWLWRRRAHWSRHRNTTPKEQLERQRVLHQGFETYGILLTCRVLRQFGFKPQTGEGPRRGQGPLRLEAYGCLVELEWLRDGTWVLQEPGGTSRLRFVSLPAAPTARAASEPVERFLAAMQNPRCASERNEPLVVLYLGHSEAQRLKPAEQRRLNQPCHERTRIDPDGPSVIPVSPADLESEERVARMIRWWWLGSMLDRYPVRLKIPPPLLDEVATRARGAITTQPGILQLVRPLHSADVREMKPALENIRWPQGPGRFGPPPKEVLAKLQENLEVSTRFFAQLLRCPVCTAPSGTFEPLGNTCYRIQCGGCSTRWGLKPCGSCGKRIPFLVVPAEQPDSLNHLPGWVDRLFGRDVLASPCWRENAKEHHICPNCRTCPNERKETGQCLRCEG
jgi:hypothetical protein